jgi:hypothetical protein
MAYQNNRHRGLSDFTLPSQAPSPFFWLYEVDAVARRGLIADPLFPRKRASALALGVKERSPDTPLDRSSAILLDL